MARYLRGPFAHRVIQIPWFVSTDVQQCMVRLLTAYISRTIACFSFCWKMSQGISSESLLMKILTISVCFLKLNWCFIEQLTLVFDSPKLCFFFAINLAGSSSVTQQGQSTTVDCWHYLDLSFLLEYCLYPVYFLALLIWKQIQHSLSL